MLLRSILTYPWIELGGKCGVKCAKSGYYADIEFHCKVGVVCRCGYCVVNVYTTLQPMYGGKKNRVTAEI